MRVESLERRRLLAAGDVDLTFGNDGFVQLPELNRGSDNPNIAATGNDHFFLTGTSRIYERDVDGNPVDSFGGDGRVDLPFESPTQIIPLSDGDILVLGETSTGT